MPHDTLTHMYLHRHYTQKARHDQHRAPTTAVPSTWLRKQTYLCHCASLSSIFPRHHHHLVSTQNLPLVTWKLALESLPPDSHPPVCNCVWTVSTAKTTANGNARSCVPSVDSVRALTCVYVLTLYAYTTIDNDQSIVTRATAESPHGAAPGLLPAGRSGLGDAPRRRRLSSPYSLRLVSLSLLSHRLSPPRAPRVSTAYQRSNTATPRLASCLRTAVLHQPCATLQSPRLLRVLWVFPYQRYSIHPWLPPGTAARRFWKTKTGSDTWHHLSKNCLPRPTRVRHNAPSTPCPFCPPSLRLRSSCAWVWHEYGDKTEETWRRFVCVAKARRDETSWLDWCVALRPAYRGENVESLQMRRIEALR